MNQVLDELRFRNEWLENAAKLVTAGEVDPGVIAHTLERMLRNRPTNAVTYSDLDEAEYSDVGGVPQAESREWAKYRANIAALEAAIAKRREADKMIPVLEAIRELKQNREPQERQEVTTDAPAYPKELDTELARYVLNRFAEQECLLEASGEYYKWKGSKFELGVFVCFACRKLGLIREESDRLKWKPFENAFMLNKMYIERARVELCHSMNYLGSGKLSLKYTDKGGDIEYMIDSYCQDYIEEKKRTGTAMNQKK